MFSRSLGGSSTVQSVPACRRDPFCLRHTTILYIENFTIVTALFHTVGEIHTIKLEINNNSQNN
jgi:hypothetical protein